MQTTNLKNHFIIPVLKDLVYPVKAMPQEIKPTNFDFDVPEENLKVYNKLSKKKKKLVKKIAEGVNLWEYATELALLDENDQTVHYYVQYKKNRIFSVPSVSQIKVWRDSTSPYIDNGGFTAEIFLDVLLPKADMIVTDKMQTPDGRRFWGGRIKDAFNKGLNVYVIDMNNRTSRKIEDLSQWRKEQHLYWGTHKKFQAMLIAISTRDDLAK